MAGWRSSLRFEDPEASAQRICDFAAFNPLHAIVSIGDRPTSTGARACHRLGLRGHPPEATDICRDKYRSRERLLDAGLEVPPFRRFPLPSNPRPIVASGDRDTACCSSAGKGAKYCCLRDLNRADRESWSIRLLLCA
jgi:hypothetical protein